MKHSSENDLNIFSSGLLGFLGVSLLLIPGHLKIVRANETGWFFILFGAASFAIALSLQIVSVLSVSRRRIKFIQSLSVILLFIFTGFYIRADFFLEGGILFLTAIFQLLLILDFERRFGHIDPFNLIFVIIGFSSGIFLAVSGVIYAQFNISNIKAFLAVLFLITAFIGAIDLILPSSKYGKILRRLQAIPWLIWCIIFMPTISGASIIPAALLILSIFFNNLLPWGRLSLTKEDILGHRVIMVASTIELTLLLFLCALLMVLDSSSNISNASIMTVREAGFVFFNLISAVMFYEVSTVVMTINGLMQELTRMDDEPDELDISPMLWNERLARYIKPFILTRENIRLRLQAQSDQIGALTHQLSNEKKRNTQLTLLLELSQQFENQLDQPVAAQLAVNTMERALHCSLASIYIHEPDRKEFMLLAAAGHQTSMIPAGYRQSSSVGAIGRAMRQRKTQIINDIRADADYLRFNNENNLSAVIIPLIFNGHNNGAIVINSENINAFSSIDIGLAESVAAELTRAWERSGYHQHLMDLIQSGSHLSSMVEPGTTAQEVASIAKDILQARFTFVHIQLGQERNFIQSAFSGSAPRLIECLENSTNLEALIQMAFQASQPFRIRDIRKYPATSNFLIDNPGLRSMLTIPIRWHRMNIGAIFAFGKQNEVFFTENDESLAELLSIQAAGAFESTWLQQELRASLRITSLLYRLSNQIIQAEKLEVAASDIAQTAHKLAKSITTGIVLLNTDGKILAEVEIDASGMHNGNKHPMDLIQDAMNSGQLIYFSLGKSVIRTCLPIQTPIRKYGAVWMDTLEDPGQATNPNDLQALVNQAAIALERSLLLVESRRQAIEIKDAYDKLEETYDQTLASLMSALDARDRETEGHSLRVSHLAAKLGETLGYSHQQLKVLERGSLLHDIGKIGISDTILHKPGPLSEEEWKIMKLHPDIGAKIVEGIPFLQDTIPLIRHHQERWDGTGYPLGLTGEDIPILARMFAVVDAFDALTSNRPYRTKITIDEALQYMREQADILFDPKITRVFEDLVKNDKSGFVFTE